MLPRDIELFLRSARTDAMIRRRRAVDGARAAFEAAYAASSDPWASASPRYRYQRMKYDRLVALLPDRRFADALDLGCGVGLLTEKLSPHADRVLGLDLASHAIIHARGRTPAIDNVSFDQADVLDLPESLDGSFDLIVVADVIYYLDGTDDAGLATLAARMARLLRPDGACLLANHFFFSADPDSRLSRRIHRAFAAAPGFTVTSEHRYPFFLASVFSGAPA